MKFCKFVWHPLEIPKSKTKTHGNSVLLFLEHPRNFHFFFNWPLEFPHVFSSRPPEIPCPQHPLFGFFLEQPNLKLIPKVRCGQTFPVTLPVSTPNYICQNLPEGSNVFFFLPVFSFTNIHDSQDSRGKEAISLIPL